MNSSGGIDIFLSTSVRIAFADKTLGVCIHWTGLLDPIFVCRIQIFTKCGRYPFDEY